MTVPGNLSSPLLATAAAGAAGAGGAKSLRFNNDDSAYLGRTPSSTGNRRTWTLSLWFKRSDLATTNTYNAIWSTGTDGDNYCTIYIDNNDRLFLQEYTGSTDFQFTAENVLRDVSAWYHVVIAFDSTQATSTNRIKMYINGVQAGDSGTTILPSQNYDSMINLTNGHSLGRNHAYNNFFFSGYMAHIYFVDGSQLGPTSFGAYDDSGVWQVADYSGTFGTNGFHLAFNDASSTAALGTDSSGNSNTFSANNFVHAGGVAGAGARSAAVLFDGTDDKISFTNNSDLNPGNGTFTLECFVYKQTGQQVVVYYGTGVGQAGFRVISNGKLAVERINTAFDLQTSGTVPENQWVHVAWVKSGTTIKGYINGQSSGTATTSQNYQGTFVTAKTLGDHNNMAISDLHLVKGTALYTSNFTPPTSISAHANTKLLCYQSSSSATATTVAPSGVTLTASSSPVAGAYPITENSDVDVLFDVPTNGDQSDTGAGGEVSGNYSTINSLLRGGNTNIANGNLEINSINSGWNNCFGTIVIPASGKWFWEVEAGGANTQPGITPVSDDLTGSLTTYPSNYLNFRGYYASGGNKITGPGAGSASYGASYTTGDIIGIAFDAGAGSLTFYKNGVSQGVAFTGLTGEYIPVFGTFDTGVQKINFGQRAFAYSAPSGYKALCTTNLPTPTVADGSDYFNIKTWTGTGSSRAITGYGFSPDFVWIKARNNTASHALLDTVRGNSNVLRSDNDTAENTNNTSVWTSFDSDGFTLGADTNNGWTNFNTWTYVGWAWDAGSSTVSNTDGSITTSLRVNQTAGFSIATYSYNNSLGSQTLGHGLGAIPDLVIRKDRNLGEAWSVYSKAIGFTKRAHLNTTATWSGTSTFGNASATNTVNRANNMNNGNYVDYSFVGIPGFSSFGTYEGNGSTDGPFVYTGHKVRFVIIKNADASGDWSILDTTRNPYNRAENFILANSSGAESSPGYYRDYLSNGFKIRDNGSGVNTNNQTYFYMSFASNPFQANGGLAR